MKKREDRTRDLVARTILENGPATAIALAKRLKITPAGIRRHLDTLIEQGVLESRDPYLNPKSMRGRGRPSKVFLITDKGRAAFEHSYDDLAVSLLKFISKDGNRSAVNEFAMARAKELQKGAEKELVGKKSTSARIKGLAKYLDELDFATTIHEQGIGEELCQNHCPIAHVASEFPELCEAETEVFSEILGTHVQRLATIGRGDGVCTTFIPNRKQDVKGE